ncbi:MAG: hypothetical protein K8I82_06440, partial [Anaerolineae bacterium]|nr:hypothetical protein [Anaerolineae bacterium]
KTLIVPPGDVDGLEEKLQAFQLQGGQIIALDQPRLGQVLWRGYSERRSVPQWKPLRKEMTRLAAVGWRAYHHNRLIRRLADGVKLPRYLLAQEHLYKLPPDPFQHELLQTIGPWLPKVEADHAVLFTMWRESSGGSQYHILNYSDQPQTITLHLPTLTKAHIYTPEQNAPPSQVAGTGFQLELKVAKVIRTQK